MTFDAFAYFHRMHLNDITILSKQSTANDSIKDNNNIEFRQIVSVHVEAEHERKIARKWHFLNWTCSQYLFFWQRQFNVWTQSHLGNFNWRWKLWRKRVNHERKCLKVMSSNRLIDGLMDFVVTVDLIWRFSFLPQNFWRKFAIMISSMIVVLWWMNRIGINFRVCNDKFWISTFVPFFSVLHALFHGNAPFDGRNGGPISCGQSTHRLYDSGRTIRNDNQSVWTLRRCE